MELMLRNPFLFGLFFVVNFSESSKNTYCLLLFSLHVLALSHR